MTPFVNVPCGSAADNIQGPSRNRHVLYCRKKLGDNLPVLRKSCAACRKAKVKCNSEFPRCNRCSEKDLVCMYELTRRSGSLAQQSAILPPTEPALDEALLVGSSDLRTHTQISWDITLEDYSTTEIGSNVDSSGAWPATGLGFSCHNSPVHSWEPDAGFEGDLVFSDLGTVSWSINSSNNKTSFDWLSLGPPPSLLPDLTFSTPPDCMFHTPYLVLRPIDRDYQSPPSSLMSHRSPFIQSYVSSSSQIGRIFLLQSIQSYATILATSNFPPFIHSASLPTHGPSLPSSAPLEICKSIVCLYKAKTPSTSPFIWRSVKMEKDRLMNEFENADKWTLLAMLQAVTVYILLRVFDQDTFSVDFDRELVSAMTVRFLPHLPSEV
jgi:Fungal Zn(2)-Cys(6) binuclear cluster domain